MSFKHITKILSLTTIGIGGVLCYWKFKGKQIVPTDKDVVFITGCDSGLGFNLALKCHSFGMTVVAGCLSCNSDGAQKLKDVFSTSNRFHVIEIDIQKNQSIKEAVDNFMNIINIDNEKKFYGLINNAGIMCFGEYEWQTESLIEKQINVNLLGTMKLTHKLLPILRQNEGRIITITSHCGLQALPGLAPYAATKGGLRFWSDALRMEMKKYNVKVIDFIPGSFVSVTNIASNQQQYANQMKSSFSPEQLRFYGKYFDKYNNYLKMISCYKPPQRIKDDEFYHKFERALLDENPKAIYKNDPLRYSIYHFLFSCSPIFIRDWLVKKHVNMPDYEKTDSV